MPAQSPMPLTLLFDEDDTVKKEALRSVIDDTAEKADGPHCALRASYAEAYKYLQQAKVYDFLAVHRLMKSPEHPLHKYNRFKPVGTLRDSRPYYGFANGKYIAANEVENLKACPFCNECFPESTLSGHMRDELESRQKNVTVMFDKSIRTEYDRLLIECSSVRELKKIVFDRTGVSVSKQEVLRNGVPLGNGESLGQETVVLRQKKRSHKK
jgi:hypothetical protein